MQATSVWLQAQDTKFFHDDINKQVFRLDNSLSVQHDLCKTNFCVDYNPGCYMLVCELGRSVSIVSGYGLDDRAIEV
jgi:hypothetical protein